MRGLVCLSMSIALLAPTGADAKRPTLTEAEKQQLPKYCWSQYVDPRYKDQPGYVIPSVCGKAMNHTCPGHLYLLAAKRVNATRRDRVYFAQNAINNFEYTMRHMTPQCPLRPEVEASLTLARFIQAQR